jgi:hypothetical protein
VRNDFQQTGGFARVRLGRVRQNISGIQRQVIRCVTPIGLNVTGPPGQSAKLRRFSATGTNVATDFARIKNAQLVFGGLKKVGVNDQTQKSRQNADSN